MFSLAAADWAFSPPASPSGYVDSTFGRVLSLAKQAGCVFHFASDAHSLDGIGRVKDLEPLARAVGITPEDILPLARSV